MPDVPADYVALEGSERRPSPGAAVTGPADPAESFTVSIVLRRRPDGLPVPDFSYYASTPRPQRRRLSREDFAARYGAADDDIAKVVEFVTSHGLQVVETDAAARTVKASGTVAQMSEAFAVTLQTYEHEVTPRAGQEPARESYRGRDGVIYVPRDLAPIIVGVFGLDNRRVTKRNNGDPPNTQPIPVATIPKLYNFPANSAVGQTIAIFSEGGYVESDINATFGGHPPTVTSISVDASNDGTADFETTQDICIAAMGAPGAGVAVYFTTYSQAGWVDLINRVINPQAGDPTCQVLSSSFYVANGDDSSTLALDGVSSSWLTAASMSFQDAAIQNVTVCIASGDTGAQSKTPDGKAHVQYPASDPWVLSVGGTSIGNVSGTSFTEYAWNDGTGASGGGVSYFFAMPSYQDAAGVPASVNPDHHVGRGVPDVAGNASPNSGYSGIYVGGSPQVGNGTSASSPLWAGLIAVINAALGEPVGFLNPQLYELGSSVCRDIVSLPGPGNNSFAGTTGYPVETGWDACTGWGSPNGMALLEALQTVRVGRVGDLDGDGQDEILVSSPWGIGVLKEQGGTMTAVTMAPNGTRLGGWLLNTADNTFGPVADYDGDGRDEILVTSPWGIGFLELAEGALTSTGMAANGTFIGGWNLETVQNQFLGLIADYDGDGAAEIFVSSAWGIGVLKLSGGALTAPVVQPNGTRFGGWLLNTADNDFGPAADYDGDGTAELLVRSPWGLGILEVAGNTMAAPMMQPNGTRFGGWLLNTADNDFGPAADYDGDGTAELLVRSPWGLGILEVAGNTMAAPMMQPNGTRFGGWLLNTADNDFGPAADYDGDRTAELLVRSPWGLGILEVAGNTMAAPMMQPNGTRFGGWLLNTADNDFGPAADYDGDRTAELLVRSPWGLGILEVAGNTMAAPMMQPNGTRFGGWLLNTADNVF